MSSKILRATAFDNQINICIMDSTEIVAKAKEVHNLSPVCSAALGRTLTMVSLLTAYLKNKGDSLTASINGGGEIGNIVVNGDFGGLVRGYVDNPNVNLPLNAFGKLDVGGAVGKDGTITIIRKNAGKQPYSGTLELVSGEIAEDFTYYFTKSEQVPSAVALGVLVNNDGSILSGGGILIQLLPNASDEVIEKIEKVLPNFAKISELIKVEPMEKILRDNFEDVKIVEKQESQFICKCNREFMEGVLYSIPKNELMDIIKKEGEVEITCHFCNCSYSFSEEEINKLFN